jgi:hypothetical protein
VNTLSIVLEPSPRSNDRARAVRVTPEQGQRELHEVHREKQEKGGDGVAPTPTRGDDEELMTSLEVLSAGAPGADGQDLALAGGDCLAVGDLRQWRHHDSSARYLGSPAEVQVLAQDGDQGVEPAKSGEEVRAHERHTARRDEDVALKVLLAVVDLAGLHALVRHAEPVAGLTHVQQDERVLVGDDLGRYDAGVGSKCRLDHELDGVVLEHDVIVAKEEEGRAVDHQ